MVDAVTALEKLTRAALKLFWSQLARLVLFGQLAPLSGDLQHAFFRVKIARALCLLLSLYGVLTVLFGSGHADVLAFF